MMKTRLRDSNVYLEGLGLTAQELKKINHIFVVACGTAYHAGLVGKYFIEKQIKSGKFTNADQVIDQALGQQISQFGILYLMHLPT